ncbi:MAG: tetratricopeptide repeat protein, partial [Holophagales bacterium]|nr:tetratricopeptide repeat protein [Holophagales bacterium]
GDLEAATEELEMSIAQRPYYAKAHYNYGVTLLQTDRAPEALRHLQRAIDLRPTYVQAHHALVSTALGLGERAEAEASLRQLEHLAPDSPWAENAAQLLAASSSSGAADGP